MTAEFAEKQAMCFIDSPTRHLIRPELKEKCIKKLKTIYQAAAMAAYMLWTRRTTMECTTLQDMGQPRFHPDDKSMVPHPSVRYEEHEDQLEGKPISIVVHPLLMAYGTQDGTNYDQGRVLMPAEVWLDSTKPSATVTSTEQDGGMIY